MPCQVHFDHHASPICSYLQDAAAEMKLVLARATKALAVSPGNRVLLLDASVLEQLLVFIASPSKSLSRHATQVHCLPADLADVQSGA